jgi:outer membrane scaffolding protein for murein synthesis (MipA/OmpV family)
MVAKLRSRLGRISAIAGAALIVPSLMLAAPAIAHAQTKSVAQPAAISCGAGTGIPGYTGSPNQSGTKFTKLSDNCANFWLIYTSATGHYGGYYLKNGVWHLGASGWHACTGGTDCNVALVTQVLVGTRLTVNNETAGYGGRYITVGI